MPKYTCDVCHAFDYDVEEGNADMGISAGTEPENFPDDWKCPICGADKNHLISE